MVASRGIDALGGGAAAELGGPHEQRVLQHATLLQVADGVEEGEDVGIMLHQPDDGNGDPVKERGPQGVVGGEQRRDSVGELFDDLGLDIARQNIFLVHFKYTIQHTSLSCIDDGSNVWIVRVDEQNNAVLLKLNLHRFN